MTDDLNLPGLFSRALATASKALSQPNLDESTQDLITSSLKDLALLHSRINDLALFSPNETLEDILTPYLVYLFVPFVAAELQGRVKAFERDERQAILGFSKRHLETFVQSLEDYEIATAEDRKLVQQKPSSIADPAKRREVKINQYKAEKEIRAHIETLRKRRGQSTSQEPTSDFGLIASLLPSISKTDPTKSEQDEDSETEDVLRQTTLLVLRLSYTQAHAQLESISQELELLKNAPSSPSQKVPQDLREKQNQLETDMWKLDIQGGASNKGPLLDKQGKPLRPFTILPAGARDRARLQAEVFGPGHNLPTMTIDEYLQIEQERGNIITGGGPASLEKPTTSEQLALDAEQDGTKDAEEKEEQKRQKDENWAQFTDANPRGAGNTMNRG